MTSFPPLLFSLPQFPMQQYSQRQSLQTDYKFIPHVNLTLLFIQCGAMCDDRIRLRVNYFQILPHENKIQIWRFYLFIFFFHSSIDTNENWVLRLLWCTRLTYTWGQLTKSAFIQLEWTLQFNNQNCNCSWRKTTRWPTHAMTI